MNVIQLQTANENMADRINCDICDLKYIHKNDYENHITSRKHRSKVRSRDKENESADRTNYKCNYCKVTLTDSEFYRIHQNSRSHKRNLRKLKIKDTAEDESRSNTDSSEIDVSKIRGRRMLKDDTNLESSKFVAQNIKIKGPRLFTQDISLESDFIRKKYKTRNAAVDEGYYKSYINSLTAFLSLRLALDQNITDFFISVNDKKWNSFGDIVINLIQKGRCTIYAIKCKQVSDTYNQVSSLNEAKIIMEKEYAGLAKLQKNPQFNMVKFAIFTTSSVTSNFCKTVSISPDILNKWNSSSEKIITGTTLLVQPLTKKNDLINVTSDYENVFTFFLTDIHSIALPNVFFFTNQRISRSMLNDLLKKKFDIYPNITKEYTKYIELWSDGQLGGNYKLRKRDIILKLGYILLERFTIAPKMINLKNKSFENWNSIIDRVDLTVVKNEPFVISKICQPINKIIEDTFSIKIDTITRSINLKDKINDETNPELKAYLFEDIQNLDEDIYLVQAYNVLWKSGKIPLLMSSEDKEEAKGFILSVITFMKQYGVNRKFVLKTSQTESIKYSEKLKIFTCLNDVKDLVDLSNIYIKVTDTFNLSIQNIVETDVFFLKWVTPAIFFDMTLGKYSFRTSSSSNDTEKNDLKIILTDEMRNMVRYSLYRPEDITESIKENVGRLRRVNPILI